MTPFIPTTIPEESGLTACEWRDLATKLNKCCGELAAVAEAQAEEIRRLSHLAEDNLRIAKDALALAEEVAGERTVASISDAQLVERAVRNSHLGLRHGTAARVCVADAFALGSTFAAQLCVRFRIDPDRPLRERKR